MQTFKLHTLRGEIFSEKSFPSLFQMSLGGCSVQRFVYDPLHLKYATIFQKRRSKKQIATRPLKIFLKKIQV